MKKISRWAKRNPQYARLAIIGSFIVLNFLGYFTGRNLNDLGVLVPESVFAGTILVFILAFLLYPEKNRSYYLRKTFDGLLATTGFVMMVCVANYPDRVNIFSPEAKATSLGGNVLPHDSLHRYKTPLAFAASLHDNNGKRLPGKERRKLLKEQIRNIKQTDDLSKGSKAGLIALSIVIASGLLILVLSAACSLSCSGYDGAAWLVAIGGTGLVIILLLVVLKAIRRGKKKKEPAPPAEKLAVPDSR